MSATAHNLFSRWRYSTKILFSGCDQATYQQDVVVHRSAGTNYEEESAGLKIWHVFVGPNCRLDYGDIRFSARNGRELRYYLWEDYTDESARFCVRLEGADAAGTLVLHYGNPSAEATSTEDAFFVFFDGSANACPTGWTEVDPNSRISFDSGSLHSTVHRDETAYVRKSFSPGSYRISFSIYAVAATDYGRTIMGLSDNLIHAYHLSPNIVLTGAGYSDTQYSYGVWHDLSTVVTTESTEWFYLAASYNSGHPNASNIRFDNIVVRAYSATPPSLLGTSRGVNPSYAGLPHPLLDEIYSVAGAGGFSIETTIRSAIAIAGAGSAALGTHLTLAPAEISGAGGVATALHLHTPITMEGGAGSVYAVPVPIEVSLDPYKFESLTVSRSIQDQMWQCSGQIDGFLSPAPYRYFSISRPDRTDVSRMIFRGYIPGRKYIQAPAANKASILAYDPTYILSRQPAPEGEISFRQIDGWNPVTIIRYLLGEEGPTASSAASRWESVTGIYPYRIGDPYARSQTVEGYSYTPKDWTFSANASKAQIIQEICEYCGYVFLVKWKDLGSGYVACAYFVHEDDIDSSVSGLDLPYPVTIVNPHPGLVPPLRADERGEERYNRITVRSSAIDGTWNSYTMETKAVQNGDELPLVYTEERSDLGSLDLVIARCAELYDYYCQTAYTYTATIENQTDLELYQIIRFSGFSLVTTDDMRIISISYAVKALKTDVTIVFTPTSRLSDLRALLRNQQADSVSEIQAIAQDAIDKVLKSYIGEVTATDTNSVDVELERGDTVTTRAGE